MLLSLHIENVAVVKSVDIDFAPGFTALTGETGAGKSIIIDSIALLLGEKAERELVRKGETQAMVSGLFRAESSTARNALELAGIFPDEDGNILVQRSVSQDGRSQLRLNGRAVSLSLIREVMPTLVSIHGQSDTHSLADSKNHAAILDKFSATEDILGEYRLAYARLEEIKRNIREATERAGEAARLSEILEYQIKDIDAAELYDGEEEELIERKLKIKNSERINKNAGFAYRALKGSEKGSVAFLIDRSITALSQLTDVIPECEGYTERLRDCLYQIEDIAEEACAIAEGDGEEPESALNKIEAKLDKISKLKRKYGLTVGDILAFRDKAKSELQVIENIDERLAELESEREIAYRNALLLAERLSAARKSGADRLEKSVSETLEFLDMPRVVFFTSLKEEYHAGERVLFENGGERVEFYISTNKGADAQPLGKIVSGGELARIMLALKAAISDKDGISTVIFDEIDAGVSGKTARKIGIKMLELSSSARIITVTHSAQIASLADTHLLIKKEEDGDGVRTVVSELNEDERINELSRILGGINVTEAQRNAAIDMLNEREGYR